MSSPITPIEALADSPMPTPTADSSDTSAFLSEFAADEGAREIEAARSEPPAEVLELVFAAGGTHTQLLEVGKELRFFSEAGDAPRIELHEQGIVREITIAEALELVAGSPLE